MDGSQAPKRFVLNDGAELEPCEDPQAHEAWMSDPRNSVLLLTKVPSLYRTVRTVFTGENMGDDEFPVYFETWIDPIAVRVNIVREREDVSMIYAKSATWGAARLAHDKAIAHARRMGAG
jgi:hypothetical protein